MLRQYRLGVKLHAFNIVLTVSQTHDRLLLTLSILGPRGHLEALWQRRGIHDQAVIPRRGEGAR